MVSVIGLTSKPCSSATDAVKSFDFGHALIGDVDFSHGYAPTAEGGQYEEAQEAQNQARYSVTFNAVNNEVEANLDITSELVEGKVELTINLAEEGLAGAQFNIKYDNTILDLENAVFDTGNEMTNFANHRVEQAIISIGSLDQDGDIAIKTGNSYKLIFNPNETLSNTSGLITFSFTEGVKQDGTKVKFNIQ